MSPFMESVREVCGMLALPRNMRSARAISTGWPCVIQLIHRPRSALYSDIKQLYTPLHRAFGLCERFAIAQSHAIIYVRMINSQRLSCMAHLIAAGGVLIRALWLPWALTNPGSFKPRLHRTRRYGAFHRRPPIVILPKGLARRDNTDNNG